MNFKDKEFRNGVQFALDRIKELNEKIEFDENAFAKQRAVHVGIKAGISYSYSAVCNGYNALCGEKDTTNE